MQPPRQPPPPTRASKPPRGQKLHSKPNRRHEKLHERRKSKEQRQGLESQLQTEITKDATKKVNAGLLVSGPAQSTTCTPVNGGSSQKLSESTGTYTCLAIYQTNSDGTSSGYGYSGTINFETGMFTWQLERGG